MNVLYRAHKPLPAAVRMIAAVCIGAAYFVCCLPSFHLIGHFAVQMALSVLLSVMVTALLFFLLPRSLTVLGDGLSVFLAAMLIWCAYAQILAQMDAGHFEGWISIFFYDKPLTVSVVWAAAFVSLMALRLFLPFRPELSQFRADYSVCFRHASGVFLVFYVCVLLYCFILQRKPGNEPGLNLIPFAMIGSYFNSMSYAYESIFYLIGNVLCFFPFGFYDRIYKPDAPLYRRILLPVVLSLLIEVSQLLFRMGDFDVDDILMNAVGFYIGCLLPGWIAKLRSKRTAGEESQIF